MLATVQSISDQTLRSCADPRGFNTAFEARLTALSQAHNLLNAESWGAARLSDLVRVEIAPYDPAFSRLSIESDGEVRIAANPAVALGMALHELATNAAKYGALSSPEGCVTVRWRHTTAEEARLGGAFGGSAAPREGPVRAGGHEGGDHLVIDWVETGGPRVAPPAHTGFGAKLLQRGLATQLSGVVDIAYDPDGLRCRMDIPLEALELSA
jgi:two-component sensor histidine kinase